MEEIEDKLNIHYLENLLDFIRFGPKYLDINNVVDHVVESFGDPESLEKLKMRLLDIHRRWRHSTKRSLRYKYDSIRQIGRTFKKNQIKGGRKGFWYRGLLLMQKWIKDGRREKAVQFAKNQMEGLKERHPRTYYYHKKDLRELGIEI